MIVFGVACEVPLKIGGHEFTQDLVVVRILGTMI
jgi:hypothetical protein